MDLQLTIVSACSLPQRHVYKARPEITKERTCNQNQDPSRRRSAMSYSASKPAVWPVKPGGAVLASLGESTVLATATSGPPRGAGDFFPLTVDVEERMYAAGKIPGSFFRREGRATEKATLLARLIDRPMRPAFPDGFRNEVHCVVTALTVDNSNPLDILSLNAVSAALSISDMPFEGPVGAVRLSHINGGWVSNPTYEQQEDETIELVVAGRLNAAGEVDIMMIEAGASENCIDLIEAGATAPNEELLADGIEHSKAFIADAIALQKELVAMAGKPKATVGGPEADYSLMVDYEDDVMQAVTEAAQSDLSTALSITVKANRRGQLAQVERDVSEKLAERFPEREGEDQSGHPVAQQEARAAPHRRGRHSPRRPGARGRAPDLGAGGRATAGARICRVHRGETQALSIATLGMQRMEQMVDDLSLDESKRYMHHYNFPPYSTGEAGFMPRPQAARDRARRAGGESSAADRSIKGAIPLRDPRGVGDLVVQRLHLDGQHVRLVAVVDGCRGSRPGRQARRRRGHGPGRRRR